MKIYMVGSRGIPGKYGGFETHFELLSLDLTNCGHSVIVSCERNGEGVSHHNGVELKYFGINENFRILSEPLHDIITLLDASKDQSCDMIYYCGLPILTIIPRLLRKKVVINSDGFEWRNKKFWVGFRFFLFINAILLKILPNLVISDNEHIQEYYLNKMNFKTEYVPYRFEPIDTSYLNHEAILRKYDLEIDRYFVMVTRLEHTNDIDNVISEFEIFSKNCIDGFKLVIAGSLESDYGKLIYNKYYNNNNIVFLGFVDDKLLLSVLRSNSLAYIHGQKTGGTSPALIEAIADGAIISSYETDSNKRTLRCTNFYYSGFKSYNNIPLNEIMIKILKLDDSERKKIKKMNRQLAYDEYGIKNTSLKMERIFSELVK